MPRDMMFPLGAPEVRDGAITVDLMLNEPTRIDNYISRLVEKNLLSALIFNNVTADGGALLFDQLTENMSTATNGPGVIAPGGEFPVLWTPDGEPMVETVKKTGGKVGLTDEAVKRNDLAQMQRKLRQIANTMVVDLDRRGIGALNAAVDKVPSALKVTSSGWGAATNVAASAKTAKTAEGAVLADIATARNLVEKTELGYVLDLLILHPDDALNLSLLLGVTEWEGVLGTLGLTPHVTTAAEVGKPLLIASRMVGSMGVESPISTESWREEKVQTHWTQTWATVAFGVTDPLAMVRIEGAEA